MRPNWLGHRNRCPVLRQRAEQRVVLTTTGMARAARFKFSTDCCALNQNERTRLLQSEALLTISIELSISHQSLSGPNKILPCSFPPPPPLPTNTAPTQTAVPAPTPFQDKRANFETITYVTCQGGVGRRRAPTARFLSYLSPGQRLTLFLVVLDTTNLVS